LLLDSETVTVAEPVAWLRTHQWSWWKASRTASRGTAPAERGGRAGWASICRPPTSITHGVAISAAAGLLAHLPGVFPQVGQVVVQLLLGSQRLRPPGRGQGPQPEGVVVLEAVDDLDHGELRVE